MTATELERVTASWGAEGGGWSVLVHGGAGDVAAERVARHVEGCRAAAQAAAEVLRGGGAALDAVERAVVGLEDDPSFNAGTGACLDAEGLVVLDASIMEGAGLRAGGVCALPPFLHPIAIARAVLEDGVHVLYAGEGAARFAVARGFAPSTSEAMTTEAARARWAAVRAKAGDHGGHDGWAGGTVGVVARDARGVVAAATSTGGRVNKRVGRVGDTPIPGAGNYADDDGGACSATGDGEAVLRLCLAKAAVDLMRARVPAEEAARAVIRQLGGRLGGTGGVILVDRDGRLGFARNTRTMTWAAAGEKLAEVLAGA
ncbi:MAG TPA: isoaspartyl peptidase/L-asparaginase [Polyangiaceae bacterium]|jgi:beta-aspartyl-peptidase (threonine type)|nr:isoaspartyl peptidase/L-asparaginase [Polyangiaceae bacterium]